MISSGKNYLAEALKGEFDTALTLQVASTKTSALGPTVTDPTTKTADSGAPDDFNGIIEDADFEILEQAGLTGKVGVKLLICTAHDIIPGTHYIVADSVTYEVLTATNLGSHSEVLMEEDAA